MNTEEKDRIIEECRELMTKAKYDDSKIEQFCSTDKASSTGWMRRARQENA